MTGLIDEKSAAKAGNLLGADIIVIGSVSELGNYYNLNVRLIEIETGKVLLSTVKEIKKNLLDSASRIFAPPNYRLGILTNNIKLKSKYNTTGFITYFALSFNYFLTKNFAFDYNLGMFIGPPVNAVGQNTYWKGNHGTSQGLSFHHNGFGTSFSGSYIFFSESNFSTFLQCRIGALQLTEDHRLFETYNEKNFHAYIQPSIGAWFFKNKNVSLKVMGGYSFSDSITRETPTEFNPIEELKIILSGICFESTVYLFF